MGPFTTLDFTRTTKRLQPEESAKLEKSMDTCQGKTFDTRTHRGARNMAILRILLYTGCRAVSITRMQWKDIKYRPDGGLDLRLWMKRHAIKKSVWKDIGPEADWSRDDLREKFGTKWRPAEDGRLEAKFDLPPVENEPRENFNSIDPVDAEKLIPLLKKIGSRARRNDPVFYALTTAGKPKKGQPITSPAVQYLVKQFGAACGIEGLTSHRFRHTLASESAEQGATLHELMAQFGWKSFAMAENYISQGRPSNLRAKNREVQK